MARFENKMQVQTIALLEDWAKAESEAARRRALAAGLKATGKLVSEFGYELDDKRLLAAVTYWFAGTIIDRPTINFSRSRGGIPMQALRDWIEKKGLPAFGGYKGKLRNTAKRTYSQDELITDMAWAMRRRWQIDRKRKGRPWNLRPELRKTAQDLQNDIVKLYEQGVIDTMLQTAQDGQ